MIYGKAVIVEGVPGLIADMKKVGVEVQKAVKRGVNRTALAIETDAKKKLTSDGHIITGRLRASIHAETKEGQSFNYSDKDGNAFDGSLREQIGEVEAVAGTNVEYAPYIEFGTSKIAADSYLGYAAVKQDKLLRERVTEEINKVIKG
jgi:hypothetical protein